MPRTQLVNEEKRAEAGAAIVYWFEILEYLQTRPRERVSTEEIKTYLVEKRGTVNMNNVRAALRKLARMKSTGIQLSIEYAENECGRGSHRRFYYLYREPSDPPF
jgi:hypothetical protein